MAAQIATTTDHVRIQSWIEARGGHPAVASRAVVGDGPPPLRVDFAGYTDAEFLDPISWEELFARFDREGLVFIHEVDGEEPSEPPYFEFVPRERALATNAGGAA